MNNRSEFDRELQEFLNAPSETPPSSLSESILETVHREMSPSPYLVFCRLSGIVLLVGVLSLTLCPQFGVGFMRGSGLMEYFMSFGSLGCRIGCGAFFIGSSLFAGSLILRPEEILVIRKHRFLQISVVMALALAGFVASGAPIYLDAAFVWFLGGLFGGIVSLEARFFLRRSLFTLSL